MRMTKNLELSRFLYNYCSSWLFFGMAALSWRVIRLFLGVACAIFVCFLSAMFPLSLSFPAAVVVAVVVAADALMLFCLHVGASSLFAHSAVCHERRVLGAGGVGGAFAFLSTFLEH